MNSHPPQPQAKTFNQLSMMEIVTIQLSKLMRKRPTKEGAEKLATFSRECDISFADTLLKAASKYFKEAFQQWGKYQAELEEHVTTFMKYYQHKIQYSGLEFKMDEFNHLKKVFQKATKKKSPQLTVDEINKLTNMGMGADEQARLYAKNKKKELSLQLQQEEETADSILTQTIEQPQEHFGCIKPHPSICQNNSDQVHWKQLFAKINLQYSTEYRVFSTPTTKSQKSDTLVKLYQKYQNLDEYTTNNRDCACCLRFCTEGQDLAFPTYKQQVSFFGPLSKCQFMQAQLTEHMVGYLNSGGGVIFIGCKKGPREEVYPNIEQTSEKQKESIENKLVSYLSSIYPSVAPKRQVDFSYVPVKNASGWMQGVYLLRLAIYPTEHHQTYFYNHNLNSHFSCQTHFGICSITGQDIYDFMCQKFHKYNPQTMLKSSFLKEKGNILPAFVFHSSACFFPEKGDQLYVDGGGGILGMEQQQTNRQQPKNPLIKPGFKFITLLVASKEVLEDIKVIFNEKEKCEALIETAFPARKYALSNSTWLIWHNVKFDRLSNGIKKESTKLKLKNSKILPILISTLNTIGFTIDRLLQKHEVAQLQKLAHDCANEKVEHKVIDGRDYFKCPSIITAVLLYFHQTNRKQKSVKFMKIPNGITSAKKSGRKPEQLYKNERQEEEYGREYPFERQEEEYREKPSYGGMIPPAPSISQPQANMPQVVYCYYTETQDYCQYYSNGWMSVRYSNGTFGQRPIDASQYQWLQPYFQQAAQQNYQQY